MAGDRTPTYIVVRFTRIRLAVASDCPSGWIAEKPIHISASGVIGMSRTRIPVAL